MTAPRGIDVSSYNATGYSTAGIGFVFVKATEGTSYVNPRHAAQVATARAGHLIVGHYHFVRPGSMSAQVSYFLQHAAPAAGDVLALDWEDTNVSGADKDAFLHDLVAAAPGHRSVLYCNLDFWRNRDHSSYTADGLWIADPDAPAGQPRIQHPWLFHQYGESAGLDLDVASFPSKSALAAWAAGTTPQEPEMELSDKFTLPQNTYNPKPQTATVGEWLAFGNQKAGAALDAANEANTKLDALTAKVDALKAAPAPTIDYAKLAAALLTALKGA